MVTRIRKGARPHLYIEEWMVARGLSFEKLGERLGKSRTTVWRWAKEQHRLDWPTIQAIAEALDLSPQDLHRPPSRPSIDGALADATDADYEAVLELARNLTRRAS